MSIRVEFYGIPRARAGTDHVVIPSEHESLLGDILETLGAQFPSLGDDCIEGRKLRAGFVVNIDGENFVTDPATKVHSGDCLLILSADAGG